MARVSTCLNSPRSSDADRHGVQWRVDCAAQA
jgi:hypothetical protein